MICGLPGGIRVICRLGTRGDSEGSRGRLLFRHSEGGKFGWLPEGLNCRGHSGTGVAFGKHSEGGRKVYRIRSQLELRDAWRTRTASGKMLSGSALGNTRRF